MILGPTPRSGLTVQCCGDAHLSNFGVFASPERRLMFDVNDFDETLPGPWEWDVKRLAASMLIAARDNGYRAKDQERIVLDTVGRYRTAMADFAGMKNLDVWYSRLDVESVLQEFASQFKPKMVKRTEKNLAKARTKDSMMAFPKLTEVVDGKVRIVDQSPLILPVRQLATGDQLEELSDTLHQVLRGYRQTLEFDRPELLEQFELADLAHKVVGVGSVGTGAWIALLLGRDGQDPLFLQVKEAEASVLEEFLGPSEFSNHGERVVVGQRLMQATSDIFLGWLHVDSGLDGKPRDFYGRQLKDWKGSAEIEQMIPKAMATYGKLCGWTLARAHARSGDWIAIAAYLGNGDSFDRAIVGFSKAYAEQNERDYQGGSQLRQNHRSNQASDLRGDRNMTHVRRERWVRPRHRSDARPKSRRGLMTVHRSDRRGRVPGAPAMSSWARSSGRCARGARVPPRDWHAGAFPAALRAGAMTLPLTLTVAKRRLAGDPR